MHVLVVEDDQPIREMIVELLEDEGYRVASAGNGREALHILQHVARPCVILLDLMMPQMNGWEFRAVQREDPALSIIPVVTLSAHAESANHASSLDAVAHIPKPIDVQRLVTTVAQYCASSTTFE